MTRQRGATLVEVLLTLLILKVGLLGVLAAQLQALRLVTEATQRTSVVALSRDILQQLSTLDGVSPTVSVTADSALAMVPCTTSSPCTESDFTQFLIARWQQDWLNDNGYGLLFQPAFCLNKQHGSMQLEASWQGRTTLATQATKGCRTGPDRNVLRLGSQE